MNHALFSSNSCEWETPLELFKKLNNEFCFTLDPCASPENAKCIKYYTKEHNGLNQDWSRQRVYCNPPYGREIGKWVKKCHDESKSNNALCVMLIPARTDTAWFHDYVYNKAEIRFLRGRLKFSNHKNSAPFPSMIVIFKPSKSLKIDNNKRMEAATK